MGAAPRRRSRSCSASGATPRTWSPSHIGGQSVSRDHKGDKGARDPIMPVAGGQAARGAGVPGRPDPQRQGVPVLPGPAPQAGHRDAGTTGAASRCSRGGDVDYPINEEVLGIQKIVLDQCLAADVLARLQNQELQVDAGADAAADRRGLPRPDRRHLVRADAARRPATASKARFALSTIRRNLQREHLQAALHDRPGQAAARRSTTCYGFVIFFGGGSRTPPTPGAWPGCTCKEIGDADRQDPRPEGR